MSVIEVAGPLGNLNTLIKDEGVKEVLFDKFASNGNVTAVIVSTDVIVESLWTLIRTYATDLTNTNVVHHTDELEVYAAMISQYSSALTAIEDSKFTMFLIPSDDKF